MSDPVVNPIAPPAHDWTPPSANVEISQEAREFALAPIGLDARKPTDQEQIERLVTARSVLGEEKFWSPKGPPAPSAAERAEADRLNQLGIHAGIASDSYAVSVPAGVAPEAGQMVRDSLAAIEMAKPLGDYIGQRVLDVGRRLHGMSEADRNAYVVEQARQVKEFAGNRGWTDLDARMASVSKMLKDAKVPELVAGIMTGDADTLIRLMIHAEHRATVKR